MQTVPELRYTVRTCVYDGLVQMRGVKKSDGRDNVMVKSKTRFTKFCPNRRADSNYFRCVHSRYSCTVPYDVYIIYTPNTGTYMVQRYLHIDVLLYELVTAQQPPTS
jgi:hypothetical protein